MAELPQTDGGRIAIAMPAVAELEVRAPLQDPQTEGVVARLARGGDDPEHLTELAPVVEQVRPQELGLGIALQLLDDPVDDPRGDAVLDEDSARTGTLLDAVEGLERLLAQLLAFGSQRGVLGQQLAALFSQPLTGPAQLIPLSLDGLQLVLEPDQVGPAGGGFPLEAGARLLSGDELPVDAPPLTVTNAASETVPESSQLISTRG